MTGSLDEIIKENSQSCITMYCNTVLRSVGARIKPIRPFLDDSQFGGKISDHSQGIPASFWLRVTTSCTRDVFRSFLRVRHQWITSQFEWSAEHPPTSKMVCTTLHFNVSQFVANNVLYHLTKLVVLVCVQFVDNLVFSLKSDMEENDVPLSKWCFVGLSLTAVITESRHDEFKTNASHVG